MFQLNDTREKEVRKRKNCEVRPSHLVLRRKKKTEYTIPHLFLTLKFREKGGEPGRKGGEEKDVGLVRNHAAQSDEKGEKKEKSTIVIPHSERGGKKRKKKKKKETSFRPKYLISVVERKKGMKKTRV